MNGGDLVDRGVIWLYTVEGVLMFQSNKLYLKHFLQFSRMTHVVSLPGKLSKIEVILQNLAVEAVLFWSYFLRKSDIFFQKSVKNGKNGKKIF